MDWKRTVLLVVVVVLPLRSEILQGAGDIQAPVSHSPDDVVGAVNTLVTLSLVCAGTVTKDRVEIGRKPFNENRPRVAVEAVFFGDPDTTDFVLDYRSIKLDPGTRYIFFARGQSSCKWVTQALPDNAETRERVREAIATQLAASIEDYVHVGRFFKEAEALVAKFLAAIADTLPEHPFLGRTAIQQARLRRVVAPRGVCVRIAGGMEETETDVGRRKIPQGKNAVLLWAGIGIDRDREFRIGAPTNPWGDAGYGAAMTSDDAGRETLTCYRQETLFDPSGMFPFCLILETPRVRKGRQELDETISAVFHKLSKEYGDLCRRPPRNIAAALACLRALAEKDGIADARRPASGFAHIVEVGTPKPYRAFQALENEWASGRMTEAQKEEAISVLLTLLTQEIVVLNETPCDGPLLRAHDVAYSILTQISGKDIPAPIQAVPRLRTIPFAGAQDKTNTPDRIKERLEVWRKWWREENSAN